jgi:hypothetical protein
MTDNNGKYEVPESDLTVDIAEFTLLNKEDYLRVDNLCKGLLLSFYEQLQQEGLSPEKATALASSADYFIRDFVVDFKGLNLFIEMPGIVRQFAGNWYILNTLEPDIRELGCYLGGISAFYRFLHGHGLISKGYMEHIDQECGDLNYYRSRIASFWEIKGEGYLAWEAECSLKEENFKAGRA